MVTASEEYLGMNNAHKIMEPEFMQLPWQCATKLKTKTKNTHIKKWASWFCSPM